MMNDMTVHGKNRLCARRCMSANSALDGHSPSAGSMAPRKKSSSPTDEDAASRKISFDDSSCTTAWNSRCSTRAHSIECTASRDKKTIARPKTSPTNGLTASQVRLRSPYS